MFILFGLAGEELETLGYISEHHLILTKKQEKNSRKYLSKIKYIIK